MSVITPGECHMTIDLHRSGRGAPLLMLHGLGMDRHAWAGLSALADRYELIACDLPGHGENPAAAATHRIEDLSGELAAAIRRAGIERTHVMGHDLGGAVAQHLAASDPGLVDCLILCGTTPTYNDDDQALWRGYAAMARRDGAGAVAQALLSGWLAPDFQLRNPSTNILMHDNFAKCPFEGIALNCEALAALDLIDLAGEIYARTLVLVGDSDTLAYREAGDWLAQSIAGAKLAFVPHAAHVPMLEQPRWMTAALTAFLG